MSDLFSRVCMVVGLCLLAVIAFRSIVRPPRIAYNAFTGGRTPGVDRIRSRNPVYKLYEAEPDATKIGEILTKNWNEGAWELATAPVYTGGSNAKVILILVQRW